LQYPKQKFPFPIIFFKRRVWLMQAPTKTLAGLTGNLTPHLCQTLASTTGY
jgi:hypothetical protein